MSIANGAVCVADLDLLKQVGADCLQAALQYLALGWSVLPLCNPAHIGVGKKHQNECKQPGKVPIIRWKECQERLPTEDEVRGWWRQNPFSNVGVALGPVSNIIRLDVDGPGGEALLRELSGGDLPPTLEFDSGRENGGRGLLYRIPANAPPLKTTPHSQGKNEELRFQARGAQTALPPSLHVSGSRYRWKPGHGPEDRQAADAPAWLIEHLRDGRANGHAANGSERPGRAEVLEVLSRLSPERCRDYTPWLQVGIALHTLGDGYLDVWDGWSQNCAEKYDPDACAAKWPTFAADGNQAITWRSLKWWARQDGGAGSEGHALGPLTLKPGKPRQTPSGKLTVPVRVSKDGQAADLFVLSNTSNGRREAAQLLRAKAGVVSAEEVATVIDTILAEALRRMDAPPEARDGSTLRQILTVYVCERFQPSRRIGRRVWLTGLGQDFDRPSFLHLVNSDMLRTCRGASDLAEGEDDYALLAKVDAEMRLIFGDLLTTLEANRPDDAPFHPSEREELAAAVIAMWTTVKSLTKTKTKEGDERTVNVSLIAQAQTMAHEKKAIVNRWMRIHPAHPAFFCRHERVSEDGELVSESLLAMNAELATSTGVRLPEGVTPFNLKKVGKEADLFQEVEGPSSRAGRGKKQKRVIVLSKKLAEYLLEDIGGSVIGEAELSTSGGTVNGEVDDHEPPEGGSADSF